MVGMRVGAWILCLNFAKECRRLRLRLLLLVLLQKDWFTQNVPGVVDAQASQEHVV